MGPDRVSALLGLVAFIDESYNKKSLLCEATYERHTFEKFNDC